MGASQLLDESRDRASRAWVLFAAAQEPNHFHLVADFDGDSILIECNGRGTVGDVIALGTEETPISERCRRCQAALRTETALDAFCDAVEGM